MNQKLRVTWLEGQWDHEETSMATATADLHPRIEIVEIGDTLVFKDGTGVALAINESRLISALRVEVQE